MKLQNIALEGNFHICVEPDSFGNSTSWLVSLGGTLCLVLVVKHVALPFWSIQDRYEGVETLAKGFFETESCCSVKLKDFAVHVDGWSVFVEKMEHESQPVETEDEVIEVEEWLVTASDGDIDIEMY